MIDTALQPLGTLRQNGGKLVTAFACPMTFYPRELRSVSFDIEWPQRSGHTAQFPEVDAARWMTFEEAEVMILKSQRAFLERLKVLHDGTERPAPYSVVVADRKADR